MVGPLGDQAEAYAELLLAQAEAADIERRMLESGMVVAGNLPHSDMLGHTLYKDHEVLAPRDMAWVIKSAALVFLMQLGFAQLEAGMCRPKNVVTTYVKNIADFLLGALAALVIGFSIAYGQVPLLEQIEAWKFFFHLVFQATASTIVSGAMAERVHVRGYMIITVFLAAFLFSTAVALTWGGGYLSQLDPPFHDFAGSGVVHVLGGTSALAGTMVLGPRINRWEKPTNFACHSIPQVLSGVLLLWVGWYGFNPGSTGAMSTNADAYYASNAAMTTTIAPATAGSFVLMYEVFCQKEARIDVQKMSNCILGGLVAITAGCNVLSPWASVVVGAGSVFVYTYASDKLKEWKIDDVVDASPVHAACGAWGCLAVGLLHPERGFIFTMNFVQLLTQILGVTILAALGFIPIYILSVALHCFGLLRASEEEEKQGVDKYLFGMQAYIAMNDPDVPSSVDSFRKRMAKKKWDLDPANAPMLPPPKLDMGNLMAALETGTKLHQELKLPNDASLATVIHTARTQRSIATARSIHRRPSAASSHPSLNQDNEEHADDLADDLDEFDLDGGNEILQPSIVGAAQESLKGEDGLRAQRLTIGGEHISALLVADGHAGPEVAAVVVDQMLAAFVKNAMDDPSALGLGMAAEKTFLQIHNKVRQPNAGVGHAGSAVTLVLINESRSEITSCSVGDSFAILFTPDPHDPKGDPVITELTTNPRLRDNPNERKRVVKEGGQLGYIQFNGAPAGPLRGYPGGVMCASAIGDREIFFISAAPFCNTFDFPKSGGVVLVASDGVWDAIKFNVAATVALGSSDPTKAAKAVVKRSIAARGLHDDITCICAVTGAIPGTDDSMTSVGNSSNHPQATPEGMLPNENSMNDGSNNGGSPGMPSNGKQRKLSVFGARKDKKPAQNLLNTLNNVPAMQRGFLYDDEEQADPSNNGGGDTPKGTPKRRASTPPQSFKRSGFERFEQMAKRGDGSEEPEHFISPGGRSKAPPARDY